MPKVCPFCNSYNIIQLGKKTIGDTPQGVWGCRECFKIFMDDYDEEIPSAIHYNPKFKNAYLKKKIPELAEHEKFKNEELIGTSDIKDLQIVWYLLKHGKKIEDLLND
jgi:Zn-finger protein